MKLMKIAYDSTAFYLKLSLLAKRAKNFNYLFLDKKPKFIKPLNNKRVQMISERKRGKMMLGSEEPSATRESATNSPSN